MKIIWFQGATANQIFHCCVYRWMLNKYPNEKIYGYYKQKFPLTVNRYFNLEVPSEHLLIDIFMFIYEKSKFVRKMVESKVSHDWAFNESAILFEGFFQDKKFYDKNPSWLNFKLPVLDCKNIDIIEKINSSNSVSIHIRRGDYLQATWLYGDTQIEYYNNAIKYIKTKIEKPIFFFFSDDINWVQANFKVQNAHYIDWNIDNQSFIDMYLMSLCKNNIIANSTFSYWAAYLNINKDKIVIYPQKWFSASDRNNPSLFYEEWVSM
jgi:hypothetical protein